MRWDGQRLNWSLRHGAIGDHADDIFNDLIQVSRQICEGHFPADEGYEVIRTRISGPVDGVNLMVERASFRGIISIQRYERLRTLAREGASDREIRVVAAAQRVTTEMVPRRRRTGPGMVGGRTGALGLVIATASAAGMLTSLSQAVLLLPLLLGLRMYWAGRIGQTLTARREAALALPPAPTVPQSIEDTRWQSALAELAGQREAMSERFILRPFRTFPTTRAMPPSSSPSTPRLRRVG